MLVKRLIISFLAMAFLAARAGALPAFPGAEGFGADTVGGRGGKVLEVTNLNDSGPGSLRAACEQKGPRVVVFRVGGVIRLRRSLEIAEPFLTIAGQTAPGGGILIRDAGIYVRTHDVVIRHLRVRVGPSEAESSGALDGILIKARGPDAVFNVVVDHCSFSWAVDENGDLYGPVRDVTLQWCIFAEGLRRSTHEKGSHSMGLLLGKNISRTVHHCLLAHNNSRNPRIGGGILDFVNNTIYNWGSAACWPSESPSVNFVGNYYKPGPSTKLQRAQIVGTDVGRIYVEGNITPHRPNDAVSEWAIVDGRISERLHRARSRFDSPSVTTQPALRAYRLVLAQAGATRPKRDAVDRRIIHEVMTRGGRIIDDPAEVGGYPETAEGDAPPDRDHDGMPDAWELAHGLDPDDASDGSRANPATGYTNLEDYLNELAQ